MNTSNSVLKCTSTSSDVNMSKNVSFASPTSPQIQTNTTPSDNCISKYPSDCDAFTCQNCEKFKKDIEHTKEIWKKHCKSEVERNCKLVKEHYEKKIIASYNKEKDLLLEMEAHKKRCSDANANLAKQKDVNKNITWALDLLLQNRQYRSEFKELLDSLLDKSLTDNVCQTDEEISTDIIARVEEVSIKKGDLDAALSRLLDVTDPNIRDTNSSIQNELSLVSDNVQNSKALKKRAERCDTVSLSSPPSLTQSPCDSDIEFIGETPAPKPSTPEKNITGKSSVAKKRRAEVLAEKENDVNTLKRNLDIASEK